MSSEPPEPTPFERLSSPDLKPQHSVTLLTPRLRLRPVRPSDIYLLHPIRRDPLTMKYMSGGGVPDPEPVAEKSDSAFRTLRMMDPDRFSFAVELRDDAETSTSTFASASDPSGGSELGKGETVANPSAAKPVLVGFVGSHRLPEIFYLFGSAYWGKGYATEAVRAWLACYWERFPDGMPGMKEKGWEGIITAGAYKGNEGSVNVLKKCGFTKVKEVVEDGKDGRVAEIYSIDRPVLKGEGVGVGGGDSRGA